MKMNVFRKYKFVWIGLFIIVFIGVFLVGRLAMSNKKTIFGDTNLAIGVMEYSDVNSYSCKYSYLNGSKTKRIYVKDNEEISIKYSSVVKEGDLKLLLISPSGKEIKNLLEGKSGNFKYKAKGVGTYSIKAVGVKTKGQFNLEWHTN
ncbi:hypothetical protein CLFE_012080 [Clostridium felsineum DSM 794]|nr:hypothetical protein CLFE_012080 [Clostridium felsineum DSM 794]